MSIFKKFKDPFLSFAEEKTKYNLKFPLNKVGNILNNYTTGDFIVVGGRKTSGKSSFILNNYVIGPIVQKITAKKRNKPFDVKLIYINTRKSPKAVIEKMIVNYSAYKSQGSKVGVPSLYGMDGTHGKISRQKAKSIITTSFNVFEKFEDEGYLETITSRKTMVEIEDIIRSAMMEYGELDDTEQIFTYHEENEELIPIISIDDVTGIFSDSGSNNIRNDNAHILGNKLRTLAKIYNVLIVLAVPSNMVYSRNNGHKSSVDEVFPYNLYADRVVILHNPMETDEHQMIGYETKDFINSRTGISYLRTIFIASNYMGPSGLYYGCFLFPETGYMMELPPAEDEEELDPFIMRVQENN